MRISSLQSFRNGLQGIVDSQTTVNKTQQQISSGRRVLTPADDPIASTKILQLQQDIAQRDQYKRNMTAAENRLKLEEAALSTVTSNLTRMKELTVQAGGGSLTKEDRQAIASEISQIQKSMVDLFNTSDAGGEFIFAGFKGGDKPFTINENGRYGFNGDEGQRFLAVGESTTVSTGDSGKGLFVDIPAAKNTFTTLRSDTNSSDAKINAGFVVDRDAYEKFYPDDIIITFNPEDAVNPAGENFTVRRASDNRVIDGLVNVSYRDGGSVVAAGAEIKLSGSPEQGDKFMIKSTPKQSITDTIHRLAVGLNALESNEIDAPTLKNLVSDTLTNLANAQASVSEVRSKLGARLNVVENARNLTADIDLVSKEVLSKLSDVDFAEAASRLSFQTVVLEAAQKSYTTISRLSLFDKI